MTLKISGSIRGSTSAGQADQPTDRPTVDPPRSSRDVNEMKVHRQSGIPKRLLCLAPLRSAPLAVQWQSAIATNSQWGIWKAANYCAGVEKDLQTGIR